MADENGDKVGSHHRELYLRSIDELIRKGLSPQRIPAVPGFPGSASEAVATNRTFGGETSVSAQGGRIPAEKIKSSGVRKPKGTGTGRVHNKVHDREEEYVLVTRDDLREVSTFGWLQAALTNSGTFFLSGAFWLLVTLLAEQKTFEFTSWMFSCVISMLFGGLLAAAGWIFFWLKQKRLKKYFPVPESEKS